MSTMARQSLALIIVISVHFLLLSTISVASVGTEQEAQRSWCIVKPTTDDAQLENIIHYCCHLAEPVNCTVIQYGGPCCNPNKVSQASVVMNLYFQREGRAEHTCDFNGSGIIVYSDPSVGTCQYPAN